MEIIGKVQNYAWGVPGIKSIITQLLKCASPDFSIEEDKCYAELWMGTHKNGPSVIKETNELLSSYIKKYPECLGCNMSEKFGNELSFLFKILSVNQALSIQAHPEKRHAEVLHAQRPDVYKDPNHKPEMALALTRFEALCGFRPAAEITLFVRELPFLQKLLGESGTLFLEHPCEYYLKLCFSTMMTADDGAVVQALSEAVTFLEPLDVEAGQASMKDLFLRLHRSYPGDVGCLSVYFLNYVVLEAGEAMFLGPNVIHAYLLGDCVECMACSDNVVRAGLTPKFKDVDVLVKMLDYRMGPGAERKFAGSKLDQYTTLFNPPVPEFAVQKIQTETAAMVDLSVESSASVLVVVAGEAGEVSVRPASPGAVTPPSSIRRGQILFVGAGQNFSFRSNDAFLAFRAFCLT